MGRLSAAGGARDSTELDGAVVPDCNPYVFHAERPTGVQPPALEPPTNASAEARVVVNVETNLTNSTLWIVVIVEAIFQRAIYGASDVDDGAHLMPTWHG